MIRDIENVKDDKIAAKRLIESVLCADADIIEVLHNLELDVNCPDEYVFTNIFPCLHIPKTQDVMRNYICYIIDDNGQSYRNEIIKNQSVQFVILVHPDDVRTAYGAARHDMLGFLIRDIFNRSHLFGHELKLVQDKESVTESGYLCRTLRFEMDTAEVAQNGQFTNKYERVSLDRQDKVIVHEPVRS